MRVLPAFLSSPHRWRWMAATLLICASGLSQAQTQAPPDDSGAGDPPSRIARLSYRNGDVGLLPAGEKDWGDASLNRPLTTGDRLSTGEGARAELQLDSGVLRIADDSNFGVLTLNDQLTQLELSQGTINVAVGDLGEGQSYEIDTPTVALVIDQPGNYRVDISEDGKSTRVTDFDGRATVYGEGGAQRLVAGGRSYEFEDSSLSVVSINDIQGGDDFDAWCNSRNQQYSQAPADPNVPQDMVGAQDLDQYGNWQQDADYGQVWYPTSVGADWSPYSDGHWSYVGPWGWTWVDAAPWGFAPYHYGRWAHVRGRWGWVPGPVGVRPVYAPALVAFVGGGVSIGIGGPVGWFPLGPGEVYNPWYRASRGYYTNVNITNIYVRGGNRGMVMNDINNRYNYFHDGRPFPNERFVNRDVPHAFRAMSGQDFVAARNARQHMAPVDPGHFANAPVAPRGVGSLAPVRASFAPPRAASERALPAGGFQREVVARTPPAAGFAARPANVAGAPRMAPAPAANNVRMLNNAGPGMRTASPGRQAEFSGAQPINSPARGNAPNPAMHPAPQGAEPAAARAGELPSARYARPNGQPPMPRGENNQPRPGVSYISNGEEDRARAQPQPGTLPAAPRFEQAPQQAARQPMNQDNAERFQRENAAPRQEPQQQPRYEQQPRQYQQQPQQQAQQQRGYEGPRGGYEPPRGGYQPPQNNNAQPRQQPAHEEHHAPPPRNDDKKN
ncbi:DUF6600 domain-containing protein [Dyella sp. C11]|uniref:DUF6600 domain-containing protein n=1 Tax=Dyella sp. C11 TaxID=2126991 RepID=UPI0018E528B6|nr:DUF6600 domain-containing protein [Dyella sp. C11]